VLRTHATSRLQPAVRLGCLLAVVVVPIVLLVTPGHSTPHSQTPSAGIGTISSNR
jgi:hypothetical protein